MSNTAIFVNMKIITKVNLPYPCALNWENLGQGDNEKLCNSCGKIVPDFSSLSDRELLNFFHSVKGNDQLYCCRLKSSQLNRNLDSGNSLFKFGKYAALFFTSFLGIKTAESQTVNQVQTPVAKDLNFRGRIVNQTTLVPVANAIVKLFDGTKEITSFTCDQFGYFDITLNGITPVNSKIKVQITTADNRVNMEEDVEWNDLKYYFRRAIPVYSNYVNTASPSTVSNNDNFPENKGRVSIVDLEKKKDKKQKSHYKRKWWKKRKRHHPLGAVSF